MQHHNPSSPISASSPTLIETPLPGSKTTLSLRERCAPLSLGPGPVQPTVTAKGFIQPHHSNLPRRHIRRGVPPRKFISETENLEADRRRWAHTACLQEIGSSSGIFVAFSPKQQQAAASSMECKISGDLSPLFTERIAELPSSSNEEERPTSSGTNPRLSLSSGSSQISPPAEKPPQLASEVDISLLSQFSAVVCFRTALCISSSPLHTHDITVPAETKDDGTPHFTETQFADACAFLRSSVSSSSPPTPNRPHPRHGTHIQGPPQPKFLVLAPKTHAADALGLAVGWGCLSGLRLPSFEADEEVDVDILSEDVGATGPGFGEEGEIKVGDEDNETPVHALIMRLHDLDPGLKDEWRGVLSRSGMGVIGEWVARC